MPRYRDFPSYENMPQFLNKAQNTHWKNTATALYYLGARNGELAQLKNKDIIIDLKDNTFLQITLHTEKNPTAPTRFIPISQEREPEAYNFFLNIIKDKEPEAYTFPKSSNEITTATHMRQTRREINNEYGVAPHYFRHCRLTHLVTHFNYNEQELVKYAGWSDSRPAKHYMHLNIDNLKAKMLRR